MIKLAKADDIDALKSFARTMIWAFPLVFCLVLPWIFSYGIPWWPLVVSAMLGIFYVVAPRLIYFPYRLWMGIALVLGWINTRIILSAVFYLLIAPMGIVMRSLKKLQYQNHRDKNQSSYYHKRDEAYANKELERPF